jgi:S1-C subfamily serine protease
MSFAPERHPMKRICWSVAILFACVFAAQSQSRPVQVHVRVILVDSELNQKPVPFLNVTLKGAATSSDVKTRLDGTAEITLPAGAYTVTTAKPVDFDGKRYSWSLRVTLTGAEETIDLTNENAKAEDNAAAAPPRSSGAASGDLTEQFKKLKNTVVTVISESGHGTGFFVDGKGLILTNQHVVAQSQYLAVQFDREHKIAARLIASDAQKDVALLWANMSALPGATPAVLARSSGGGYAPVQEGERVFTIGSPLSLDKIITTGIVSKVDAHTIMSDININPGNSGGPLFNNAGHVVGLTTFDTGAERGPGVSGVVRIEEALALLEKNRGKATGTPPPAALLPVEPLTPYPVEGLKAALQGEKFDFRPYYLNAGDFEVALSTPPFDYRKKEEYRLRAERTQKKRNRRDTNSPDAAQQDANRDDSPRDWESETGGHQAVLGIYALPKLRAGVSYFAHTANLKFKADFRSMKLFCGEKEVQPIHPGRIPLTMNVRNAYWKVEDSTYKGAYFYPPDAVNPQCGTVKIAIYSSKSEEPVVQTLDGNTTTRIWADFDAFRRADAEVHSTHAQK